MAVSSPRITGVLVTRDGIKIEPSFWKFIVIMASWKVKAFDGKMSLFSLFSHGILKINLMFLNRGTLYCSDLGNVMINCFAVSSHLVISLGRPKLESMSSS
jgi:hypothetical protein